MPTKLQDCVNTSDDIVNDEEELVQYDLYADIGPINVIEVLKDSKWMQSMMEELKSIEANKN